MDGKTTIKYVVFYQLLAAVAAILGFAAIGLGVLMGFGESIDIVLQEAPQDWGDAMNAAQPVVFAALTVVGVAVWQLGKTLALVVTIGKVADASSGAGGAGGADVEDVRSAVMEGVDDRISGVEADVKKHEQRLSSDAAGSSAGGTASASSENRRSRRRGTAATGDDANTSKGSSASGSSSATESGDAGSSGSDSNRRSNRRASRGDGSDGADSA